MAKARHFKFCTLVRHVTDGLALGLQTGPLSGCGHGHVTFLNFGK